MSVNVNYESTNFTLLKSAWPALYNYANAAEANVHLDPSIVGFKLRCFVESMTHELYKAANLPRNRSDDFYTQLNNPVFANLLESEILQKFNVIRIAGNHAVHCKNISSQRAVEILEEAFLLTQWFCRLFGKGSESQPEFCVPVLQTSPSSELVDQNEKLIEELAEARAELEAFQARSAQEIAEDDSKSIDPDPSFAERARAAIDGLDLKSERTRQSLKLADSFTEYNLTDNQSELVGRLHQFLESTTDRVFILKGYAGTGKTFVTKGLTEYLRSMGRGYVLAAPTGKAAKVIREKTGSEAFTIHRTIYSLSKFVEYKEKQLDGSETFKYYSEIALNEGSVDTVYIFDEASMISDVYSEGEFFRFGSGYLLRDLFKFVNLDNNDHKKKIIFIGDDAQLPPVRMNASPALEPGYLKRNYGVVPVGFELTEVVRQKNDSGVMTNAVKLRECIEQQKFNRLSIEVNCSDVFELDHADLMPAYLRSCNNKINADSIIIAAVNKDVADYNRTVREHFFPGADKVVAGDKVMSVMNAIVDGVFISNGDFGLVREVLGETERRTIRLRNRNSQTGEVEQRDIELCFKEMTLAFRQLGGEVVNLRTKVVENLLYSHDPNLSSDETKALYIDFCIRHPELRPGTQAFKDKLFSDPYFKALRLKFGYAITGHKAQGSEWNNVFIKCSSKVGSQRTSSYFRWLYTAFTRTKDKVWLLDAPKFNPLTDVKVVSSPGDQMEEIPDEGVTNENSEITNHKTKDSVETVSDNLAIPETAVFRLALLKAVRERLDGTNFMVVEALPRQYQEHYTIKKGEDFCRIAVVYNGKAKIRHVLPMNVDDISTEVAELLSPMTGKLVSNQRDTEQNINTRVLPDLGEDFLNEHCALVQGRCSKHGINLLEVERKPWNLRYQFERGGETAVVDIYFKANNMFSKVSPMAMLSSSGALLSEATALVTMEGEDDNE